VSQTRQDLFVPPLFPDSTREGDGRPMTGRKRFLDAAASPPEAPLPVPAVLTAATLGIDERGTRRSAPRPGITDSSPAIARARDALRGIGPGADHFDTPQHENEPQRGEKTLHAVAGCRPAQKAVAGSVVIPR
jgi:hypothetical protein